MRIPIFFSMLVVALGLLLSFVAKKLFGLHFVVKSASFSSIFAAILLVLFASFLIGLGAGFFIHSIIQLIKPFPAFLSGLCTGFALFFIGVGITLMSKDWWFAVQYFSIFVVASLSLFALSFISFFGGIFNLRMPNRKRQK